MSTNVFEERHGDLVQVDYGKILDAVLRALGAQETLFKVSDGGRLMANVSEAAETVSDRPLASPLIGPGRQARSATVNFQDDFRSAFPEKIRAVSDALRAALERASQEKNKTVRDVVDDLGCPLEELRAEGNPRPGFRYEFPAHDGLSRRKLSLQGRGEPGGRSSLSLHRLAIEIDASKFEEDLGRGLANHVEQRFAEDEAYEEIEGLLEHSLDSPEGRRESGLERTRGLLTEWALGVVKREASAFYLDFLLGGITKAGPGRDELARLRDRMHALRGFVEDPARADAEYTVAYGDATSNVRESFSQPEAFSALPVVPQVEGSLGERRDDESKRLRYTYGLKFKLNGAVASTGHDSSLDYHADLIDPGTALHESRLNSFRGGAKIAEVALLYAFFFDPEVEDARSATSPLAERLIGALKGSDTERKREALGDLATFLRSGRVRRSLEALTELLRESLSRDAVFADQERAARIGLSRRALAIDAATVLESDSFFAEGYQANPRTLLKHVSVADADAGDWLFSMPLQMNISNPRFAETADGAESYRMSYETEGLRAMPVFLGLLSAGQDLSSRERQVLEAYKRHINRSGHSYVLFPYGPVAARRLREAHSSQAFVYSLVFGLLAHLTLELLLSHARQDVYVPILRFQAGGKDDSLPEEDYFRSLSKTIAHLISRHRGLRSRIRCISRSQGLVVTPKINQYAVKNASSSMYAGVPMRFAQLPRNRDEGPLGSEAGEHPGGPARFAIIAVSSWESDAPRSGYGAAGAQGQGKGAAPDVQEGRLSCAYGEATTLDRQGDGSVLLEQFGTFSGVHDERRLHRRPESLREVVDALYARGYRHVALVSRSPFQSRLILSGDAERLYFLSKETLGFLRAGRDDLRLYPIFFDRYFAVKPGKKSLKADSLYIQDAGELKRLTGLGRSTVPFLHIFNGISVGRETFYNGTLAYSAVLGAYEGILDEQATLRDLVFEGDGQANPTKEAIVRYLALFHFSRFEKSVGKLGFSLNPFSGLFGGKDESVGGRSVFPHARQAGPSPNFNSLAFLSEATKALVSEEAPVGGSV